MTAPKKEQALSCAGSELPTSAQGCERYYLSMKGNPHAVEMRKDACRQDQGQHCGCLSNGYRQDQGQWDAGRTRDSGMQAVQFRVFF